MMEDDKRTAVLMYQLCFAEERRLAERLENARSSFLRNQGELDLALLYKSICEANYQKVIAEKIFDILRSLDYNGDSAM